MTLQAPQLTPQQRRRRWLASLATAALALVVAVLVVLALRPGTPPSDSDSREPVTAGAISAQQGVQVSWTGHPTCGLPPVRGTTTVRVRDESGVHDVTAPLDDVRSIAVITPTRFLVVGHDKSCVLRIATSSDSGASWSLLDTPTGVTEVSADAGRVLYLSGNALGDRATVGVLGQGQVELQPCGAPSLTTLTGVAVSAGRVWVVCEEPATSDRTIAIADGPGWHWRLQAATGPGSGLNGAGTATRLVSPDVHHAWLLIAKSSRCRQGDLRSTEDGGLTWTELPCFPSASGDGTLLDATFDGAGQGLALLVRPDGTPTTATTSDGGRSWQLTP